jgi:peptide/nickel transport system permease protein
VRRLAHSVIVLLGLVVAVFFFTHMLGDPARLMLRPEATAEQVEAVRDRLGLNDPLHEQFFRFMGGAVRGDFGESIWQRAPALPIMLDRLPNTLYLAGVTILIAIPLAALLGIVSALRPGSIIDRASTVVGLAGVSIADFWLGLMLILFFAVNLDWLPTSGFGGPQYVILPALALMVRPLGRICQVIRSSMLDQLSQP